MQENTRILIALLDQLSEKYESLGMLSESASLDKVTFLLGCTDLDIHSIRKAMILSGEFGLDVIESLNVQRALSGKL